MGDFVWQDLNGDGIQQVDEPGLDQVEVRLLSAAGQEVAATTTASGGFYGFAGLTPGTYRLEFAAPAGLDFTPPGQGADRELDSDVDPATQSTPFALTAGQSRTDLDAGLREDLPVVGIPTLSTYGLVSLCVLLAGAALAFLRQPRVAVRPSSVGKAKPGFRVDAAITSHSGIPS